MKKLLALLFVCAGLTAMAAPHVNKADLLTANKGQMVMKTNTMANQMTAGVSKSFMEAAKKNVQMNHATNLVNKRAPRRLTNEEIINNPYVCFLYAYDIMGDEPVQADPFYAGSGAYWYPNLEDGLYFAGFYWDADGSTYYLPVDIDYATGEVNALDWGILLKNDSVIGTARNRTDTVWYEILVTQDYWENNDTTHVVRGTLYEDGSIIFDDNYVYYTYREERVYKNRVLDHTDSFESATMFVGTEILAANGVLSFIREQNGEADSSPVYMFQNETGDELYVGNMWNYGMPDIKLTISPEAKMNYNCIAEVDSAGVTYLENPIWDLPDSWIQGGLGEAFGIGGYTTDDEGYIDELLWGFEGDVTPEQITWEYAAASNGYHLFYGFNNNVLTWTNGNTFRIPTIEPEFIRGDVNNDKSVNIADVTALIDALLTGNLDDSEDFSSDAADCDESQDINIADVTSLIDFLLRGEW